MKSSHGETIQLMPEGTFKVTTYSQRYFNAVKFYDASGQYEVKRDRLNLNSGGYQLKKFSPDTIIAQTSSTTKGRLFL